jgi:hypothetical protein
MGMRHDTKYEAEQFISSLGGPLKGLAVGDQAALDGNLPGWNSF